MNSPWRLVALMAIIHALWVTITRPLVALSDLFLGASVAGRSGA